MDTRLPSNYPERVCGAIVSAAVGDALGWPQEARSNIVGGQKARDVPAHARFRAWDRNSGTQYARYQETVESGEYSDDTQLLLAVARSCLTGDRWLTSLTRVELPTWTLYPRGAGRAVIAAARSWADGHPPWVTSTSPNRRGADPIAAYFNAGANGAAMRAAPHAVISADADTATLLTRVITDAITTHGHPRALVGAAVHALALRYALLRQGVLEYGDLIEMLLGDLSWQNAAWLPKALPDDWSKVFEATTFHPVMAVWQTTVRETIELLQIAQRSLARAALANDEQTLEALGCYDRTRNGSGTITAVAAAYIATRTAARPVTGLLRTAFLPKGDTDTLASMTASLLGAIHGTEWLGPLASAVQDATYLQAIGTQLASVLSGSGQDAHQQTLFDGMISRSAPRVRARNIGNFRDAAFSGNRMPRQFPDGRRIENYQRFEIAASGKASVKRLRLHMEDGQTLVLDKVTKSASEASKPGAEDINLPTRNHNHYMPDLKTERWMDSVVQVTLRVSDLERSLRFYRDVLNLPVERIFNESVNFVNGLTLTELSQSGVHDWAGRDVRDVLITIKVQDFYNVVGRMRSSKLGVIIGDDGRDDRQQLRVRDPDGHDLKILAS
jgi:ADP-ribosylglycohydrolase/catechol 2,3-dioxygenase-like lactoylglutathione lyase family enzyme